jgi:hypothetical protein
MGFFHLSDVIIAVTLLMNALLIIASISHEESNAQEHSFKVRLSLFIATLRRFSGLLVLWNIIFLIFTPVKSAPSVNRVYTKYTLFKLIEWYSRIICNNKFEHTSKHHFPGVVIELPIFSFTCSLLVVLHTRAATQTVFASGTAPAAPQRRLDRHGPACLK